MVRLARSILIIGDQFNKSDLDLIEKAHGSIGVITIRALASFSDQKDLLEYVKESRSTVYVTSNVSQVLIDSIKKSGSPVGVLMGHETLWYNITGYGHCHSLKKLLETKAELGVACTMS